MTAPPLLPGSLRSALCASPSPPPPGCRPAGVRGSDFVCFYDWNEGRLVRRIDVGAVKEVIWSDNGELVAIAGDASFYILQVG